MAIEDLDRLFGKIAVEKGFITLDQLKEAMDISLRNTAEGYKFKVVSTILRERGLITFEQIDEVINTMLKESK